MWADVHEHLAGRRPNAELVGFEGIVHRLLMHYCVTAPCVSMGIVSPALGTLTLGPGLSTAGNLEAALAVMSFGLAPEKSDLETHDRGRPHRSGR